MLTMDADNKFNIEADSNIMMITVIQHVNVIEFISMLKCHENSTNPRKAEKCEV